MWNGLPSRCCGTCESAGTTDGEPAILDLMGEVARLRGDLPTVLEHGAPGDSQSNGFVERAIRSVEDMIRTHKLALEEM